MSFFSGDRLRVYLLFCLSLYLTLTLTINLPIFAQSSSNITFSEDTYSQGIEFYRAGDYQEAIAKFKLVLDSSSNITPEQRAKLEEKLARSYYLAGYGQQAIEYWDKAISHYLAANNQEKITKLLIEKAQSYLILGRAREAIAILCSPQQEDNLLSANEEAQIPSELNTLGCQENTVLGQAIANPKVEMAARGSYADALRLVGGEKNYQDAIDLLEHLMASNLEIPLNYEASIYLSLGQIYSNLALIYHRRASYAKTDKIKAKDFKIEASENEIKAQYYFESILNQKFDNSPEKQIQAQLDLVYSFNRSLENHQVDLILSNTLEQLDQIPDFRKKALWLIEVASLTRKSNVFNPTPSPQEKCDRYLDTNTAENLLTKALNIAKNNEDIRLQSFAQGELGRLHECQAFKISTTARLDKQKNQQLEKALNFTINAQKLAAQNIENQDSLYLWQWQAARIYRELKKTQLEKQAYANAINTLTTIRSALISGNKESRFDFRDNVEPIYRNFAKTLLAETENRTQKYSGSDETLHLVNQTLDELRLAELQNFFGNDCNLAYFEEDNIDKLIDDKTAIIRTIISAEKTYIIATFSEDQKSSHSIGMKSSELETEIQKLKLSLSNRNNRNLAKIKKDSQLLYEILFPPSLVQELDARNIETLVFIHDGLLQSIPMAALFDGEHYLIEKYAIAMTPSLQVTVPKSLEKARNRPVLLAGLLTRNQNLQYLPFAEEEINTVNSVFNGKSVIIPDEKKKFNVANITSELRRQSYSVVHIVTHGKFTFEPASSYILTEDSQKPKLSIPELEKIIRQSSTDRSRIDLLTLSGCETAVGDQRSTLGLAGIAIQAGVNSAIASLWQVEDSLSTSLLMEEFYQNYLNGETKARALQHAQVKLINGQDNTIKRPYYWSPFVLIGNWR